MGSHQALSIDDLRDKCVALVDTSIVLLLSENILKYEDLVTSAGGCILAVTASIINELNNIASRHTEKGRIAMWALDNIVPRFSVIREETVAKQFDHAVMDMARKAKGRLKIVVVTADVELKNTLIKQGIDVVWYRKAKNKLERAGTT